MTSERYTIGREMLQRVDGKGGDAVVNSLKDIAPDFARYLIEFPFGDIYARPGLDLRSREIATSMLRSWPSYSTPRSSLNRCSRLTISPA